MHSCTAHRCCCSQSASFTAQVCVCLFVCFTPLFHWIFMFGNRSQYARKSSESYAQNNNFPIIILYVTEYAVFLALFSSRSVYLSHFSMKRFPLSLDNFFLSPALFNTIPFRTILFCQEFCCTTSNHITYLSFGDLRRVIGLANKLRQKRKSSNTWQSFDFDKMPNFRGTYAHTNKQPPQQQQNTWDMYRSVKVSVRKKRS